MFTALESVGAAAMAEDRIQAASEAYRFALRNWRGPALTGVVAAFVDSEARLFEERRRVVFCRFVDIELALDRPQHLVPTLFREHHVNPLDEGVCLRLMAALQRSGRTVDALEVYRGSRARLRRDLGIDPHETLQAAERSLLRSEAIDYADWSHGSFGHSGTVR